VSDETNFEQENKDTEDIENTESIDSKETTKNTEIAEEPVEDETAEISAEADATDLFVTAESEEQSMQVFGVDEVSGEPKKVAKPEKKRRKDIKISLGASVVSIIAAVLATVILTSCILSDIYKAREAKIYNEVESADGTSNKNDGAQEDNKDDNSSSSFSDISEKTVIDLLLDQYFYGDIDKDKLTAESLRAYLAATGDIYAAYYTQEELDAANQEGAGKMQGIGVNIINSTVEIGGFKYAVLKITNVMKDSPAQEQGLRAGDLIYSVGTEDKKTLVNELGYDEALNQLKGVSGTVAKFSILRLMSGKYEEKYFSVTRREVTTDSVYSRVYSGDSKIGIVRILDFELNTPTQFENAIEDLKKQGCEKFVIDVRYNPGGYLISIAAVLSYFLEEGDVYIRTEDKSGNVTENKIGVVEHYKGDYAPCNISQEDIGKYKDLDMVVLCNEYTASAAELFTATFRDYSLGKIVGTTTFGKGKMQTTYPLQSFGLEGAVKFTTHMYYSAKSEGYDGIGIKPDDGCEIQLSEEAMQYNIYDLPDNKDNQLLKAIEQFK